jgi:hypothetical protein
MKRINEILESSTLKPACKYQYQEPFVNTHDIQTARIVNKLFATFQGIFPAFRQAWPTEGEFERAKKEWIKAFQQIGLSDVDLIKKGVEKYRLLESPFVPSPGQFIALCKKIEIKPQSDTRNLEDFALPAPERTRRLEYGREQLQMLKDMLR